MDKERLEPNGPQEEAMWRAQGAQAHRPHLLGEGQGA